MSLDTLKTQLPDFAKDVRLNLSMMIADETLNQQQKYGLFVACAIAARNATVRHAFFAESEGKLDTAALNAAKSAATIMAMNNVYYRFIHYAANKDYKMLPANLRMNAIKDPGVDKVDFELWAFAVSVMNGCGMCMNAHEAILLKAGASVQTIQTAARFASIIQSIAIAVEASETSS